MVGSASGPGSTFKVFIGSARVRVPLSNKIWVNGGSVQHIYGSLRVRVRIFGPVKTSTRPLPQGKQNRTNKSAADIVLIHNFNLHYFMYKF